ncbi:MAG: DUF5063 domain-containing protein [Planctomycetota bacterium]
MQPNALDRFAKQAERFVAWCEQDAAVGTEAAAHCLRLLVDLFQAGLELPPYEATDQDESPFAVSHEDWDRMFQRMARLPLDMYGTVFDPLLIPPAEPVVASLADDLADIYRDVVVGLRCHKAGLPEAALWEWA